MMKRILTLALALLMLVSMIACTSGNGGNETDASTGDNQNPDVGGETAIDTVALDRILEIMIDMSKLQFGPFFQPMPVSAKEEVAALIGSESFSGDFAEALAFMPMMGSDAFQLILFRLAEGGDVNAFAAELETGANPNKWICVTADAMDTRVAGQTVLFVMASTNQTTALLDAFTAIAAPGFDADGYEMRDPLEGVSMEDVYGSLSENCAFLQGANKGTVSASTGFGLGAVDASTFTDSLVDYDLSVNGQAYVIAMFRLAEGQDAAAFAANLKSILDTSSLDMTEGEVQASYSSDVVVICAGSGWLSTSPSDVAWALEMFFGMTLAE